uniref:Uncharacterized protein n=1 Tax=Sipha flava TaxID=143950 RepID=A0A2S2R2Z0_9HEMI
MNFAIATTAAAALPRLPRYMHRARRNVGGSRQRGARRITKQYCCFTTRAVNEMIPTTVIGVQTVRSPAVRFIATLHCVKGSTPANRTEKSSLDVCARAFRT